jgi:hypothetical protein
MRVRLIRKLADRLDGVDVSRCVEGDELDLDRTDARVLVAEGWARPVRRASELRRYASGALDSAKAADVPGAPRPRRRAEDRLRDELHDRRARTVTRDG